MTNNNLSFSIPKNPLTTYLDQDEFATISQFAELCTVEAGDYFIRQGDCERAVFIIKSGSAEVLKKSSDFEGEYQLTVLKKGSCIGEMALIENDSCRSASVRTLEKTELIKIDFDKFIEGEEYKSLYLKVVRGIANELSDKLRNTNEITVQAMKKELEESKARVAMGVVSTHILIGLSIYTLTLRNLVSMIEAFGISTFVSLGVLAFFAVFIYTIMKKSNYPLKKFGLHLNNWKGHLKESVLLSLPIMLSFLVLKWVLITFIPMYNHEPLFNPAGAFYGVDFNWKFYFFILSLYCISCVVQEFIARAGLQSAFANFLPDSENRTWMAIIISNLLFAMAHSHKGILFALGAAIPGLFWGWLYSRQKSVIGVIVSHIMIGSWTIFILSINFLI